MNTPACFPPSSFFHSHSSSPAKYATKRILSGTALLVLLFLFIPGSSALAQTPLTPSRLSFGNQVVNQSSAAISATLKNPQAVPLNISSIAISSGTAPADYVAGGNCPVSPSTLGPGETCTITVTFTPSAQGMRTATLTVTDDGHTSPATVSLRGVGVAPVEGTPGSSNIGAVAVGYTGATSSGTLTNNENGAPTSSGMAPTKDLARGRPGAPKLPSRVSGGPSVVAPGGVSSPSGLVSIIVTPANPSIAAGNTLQFTATGTYSNGSTQNLTASVAWSSSAPGVATITAAGLASGVSAGSPTIIATLETATAPPTRLSEGQATGVTTGAPPIVSPTTSGISGSTTLTVTAPTLVSIAVTPANPSIAAGKTQQFTATGTYSDGSMQNLASTATWSSSATAVATITATGLATALAPGQTTIAAASGAINGATTLTVTAGFVYTGNLNTGRELHTATLLNNGMVLIAGGAVNSLTTVTAELYNPAARTFTPTGNMTTYRGQGFTATLLNNGMVLFAGGISSPDTAELYNPATGTFTPTGSMQTPRLYHTATLLSNGMVLMAGGENRSNTSYFSPIANAELYNPATGTFTSTGSLNTVRSSHTATLLDNGMVLIAGGATLYTALPSAELYNPATGTFTLTGNLNSARLDHTATLLNSGLVLIAGGYGTPYNFVAGAELYNPATGSFSYTTTGLNTPRIYNTTTLLNNGMVLIAGGQDNNNNVLASAELYDPASGAFTLTGSLNTARNYHSATLLNNGMVLMAGGQGAIASAELYEPATLVPPNLVSVSLAPTSPTIALGTALHFTAFGTFSGGNTEQLAEVTWSSSNPGVISVSNDSSDSGAAFAMTSAAATITACAGSVCGTTTVTVGPPGPNSVTGTASFGGTASLSNARQYHTATLLNNGLVLIAGGEGCTGASCTPAALASAELYDPANGTLALTGSLETARWGHTATLLNDGTVLVAGGIDSTGNSSSTAELYHPETGNFTPTGSLLSARAVHTATLLANGLVLMAGGIDGNLAASNGGWVGSGTAPLVAELYNPATGTFSPTGSLMTGRAFHTATLLADGQVLMAGGFAQNGTSLNSAELYNSATGAFTLTGNLTTQRYVHTATLLNDGTVLLAGGAGANGILASAERYNPATQTFTATGSMSTARDWFTATLLNNGSVLMAGGVGSSGYLASVELYDPASGSFAPTGSLNTARYLQTATLLNNGLVFIVGGEGAGNVSLTSAELYDPATLTPPNLISISLAPSTPTIPLGTAQTFIATGTFSGGVTEQLAEVTWSSSNPGVISVSNDASDAGAAFALTSASATISACAGAVCGSTTATVGPPGPTSVTGTSSFDPSGTLNTGRAYHTATLLNNGLVLIAGGYGCTGASCTPTALGSAALYNPATGTFTLTGSLNTGRQQHTATLLSNGMVLITGGMDPSGNVLASAELYNPATGTFRVTGGLLNARFTHTSTLLGNGMVLIVGGFNLNIASPEIGFVAAAELYDPATGAFSYTAGGLNTARSSHTATLLKNGMVLIGGGWNDNPVASGELYNPATGTFSYTTGGLNTARYSHTATLLNNGTVLLAGGEIDVNGDPTNSAELYNPVTGTFSATGSLLTPRYYHTATLLNNGMVLMAGGANNSGGGPTANTELYDPTSGSFTPGQSLNTARDSHTATLLNNGQVLVVGGNGTNGALATSELYNPGTQTPPNLVSISISPAGPTIPLDSALALTAVGTFSTGITEPLSEVTWSSSSPGVISVSNDSSNAGTAYAAASGSATITACAGVVCASTTATVGAAAGPSTLGTSTFASTGNLNTARYGHTATLLNNGLVLMAGGADDPSGDVTNTAELYDPTIGAFTATGSLSTPRKNHTATLLNNGMVLLAGGQTSNSTFLASAEL
ncbi:MAG: kelch repeat-containing protein, partial [Terriglobia bacterium]